MNRLEMSEQLDSQLITQSQIDVEIGGVGISQHHRVQRVEGTISVIVTRSSHHQHVGEVFVELWNVSSQYEGRQSFHSLSIVDVVSGDVVIQSVEWNGIDDVVIVVLYSSAFPITITILVIDTKVLQGERRWITTLFDDGIGGSEFHGIDMGMEDGTNSQSLQADE